MFFVLDGEFDSVSYLLSTKDFNGSSQSFLNAIHKTAFRNIYLCVWCFESQTYEVEHPILLHIFKGDKALLEWKYYNKDKTGITDN